MDINIHNLTFDYNSVVILTYFLLSLGALILNYGTKGMSNQLIFSSYRSSIYDPLTYVRLLGHSIGHQDWQHFIGNFLYILLVGPMIEEKYGSTNLLVMLAITSVVIGIFNALFDNYNICGASGNVYMLIVLSSFSNISEGKIPITLILVLILYLSIEIKNGIRDKENNTYHLGHLMGMVCGAAFGFILLYHPEIFTDYIAHLKN